MLYVSARAKLIITEIDKYVFKFKLNRNKKAMEILFSGNSAFENKSPAVQV